MRQFLSIPLVSLVLLLAACGGDDDEASEIDDKNDNNGTTAAAEANTAVDDDDPILLTLDVGDRVMDVVWSPDGTQIACASWNGTVTIWEVAGGSKTYTLAGHTNIVYAVAWSPDGSRLASVGDELIIWDTTNWAALQTLQPYVGDDDTNRWSTSLVWSPDGSRLVNGTNRGVMRIWDTTGWQVLNDVNIGELLDAILTGNLSVAQSPDGTRMAVALGLAPGAKDVVAVVDTATGSLLYTLEGHTDWVMDVAWSPDGQWLATGSRDQTVRVWDADTGAIQHVMTEHTDTVTAVTWSLDGRLASVALEGKEVYLWEAPTGIVLETLVAQKNVYVTGTVSTGAAWSPDGTRLAVGTLDETIVIYNVPAGE